MSEDKQKLKQIQAAKKKAQGLLEDLRKLADLGQFGDFASEVGATKDVLKALAIAEIWES
jgi:hypothetical protein